MIPIQLIQHFPSTEEGQRRLARLASAVHLQIILLYLEETGCPEEEKQEILDFLSQKESP